MAEKTDRTDKGFRKLIVWQKAHQLAMLVYRLTGDFPKSEMFGLTAQMRRAAVSVPANIAEGRGAGSGGQFGRFLGIAQGSLTEVEYYLILSRDLDYVTGEKYQEAESLRAEVGFLLYRLMQKVRE
jgi:four helix bundle protein